MDRFEKINIGLNITNNSLEGPQIFLEKLRKRALEDNLASFNSYFSLKNDISIFASVAPILKLSPFVLRLDGIYYDKGRGKAYNNKHNKPILRSYNKASGFIFQSHFSKTLVESYFGIRNIPKEVILNGSVVTKEKTEDLLAIRKKNKRKVIICSANWRPNKRLNSIIKTVVKIRKYIDCELIIIGKVNQPIPDEEFIKPMGYVKNSQLYDLIKYGNAFIHLCLLDNCPNSVIEAIANRLPVISSNLGGTKELILATNSGIVSKCDGAIDYREHIDQQNPPEPDLDILTNDLESLLENEELITKQMNIEPINIKNTANAYIEFARELATQKSES